MTLDLKMGQELVTRQGLHFRLMPMSEVVRITPEPESQLREELFPGYYSHWCSFKGAQFHVALRDCVTLVHGPQGCMGNQRLFLGTYIQQFFGHPFVHGVSSNMSPSDVILGGDERLRDALREVDKKYRPKHIFILVTCCAGVTREPVEDVAEEMQDEIQAGITVLRVEGFTYYSSGRLIMYLSQQLGEMVKPPRQKRADTVNLLGVAKEVDHQARYQHDPDEMRRLVEGLGLKVGSVLMQGADLDDLFYASEAGFNAMDCPTWGVPMAKVMQERYGVPYARNCHPVGPSATESWLREIAAVFGREKKAEELISEEWKPVRERWDEARRLVDGKYALIDGGDTMSAAGRSVVWARLARDLGMQPIIFNNPPLEIKAKPYLVESMLANGVDPAWVYFDYAYHRRFRPHDLAETLGLSVDDIGLYMGEVYPTAVSKGETPIFDPSNVARITTATHCSRNQKGPGKRSGFRGMAYTAEDVIMAVRTAERKEFPTLFARVRDI